MLKKGSKSLIESHPDVIASHWDYKLNAALDMHPDDYSAGSHVKVWWHCGNPVHDAYLVPIRNFIVAVDTLTKSCPQCAGRKPVMGVNDAASICPHIVDIWDYEKNGSMPSDYTSGSSRKIHFNLSR